MDNDKIKLNKHWNEIIDYFYILNSNHDNIYYCKKINSEQYNIIHNYDGRFEIDKQCRLNSNDEYDFLLSSEDIFINKIDLENLILLNSL
jgi:hypothetical protein